MEAHRWQVEKLETGSVVTVLSKPGSVGLVVHVTIDGRIGEVRLKKETISVKANEVILLGKHNGTQEFDFNNHNATLIPVPPCAD